MKTPVILQRIKADYDRPIGKWGTLVFPGIWNGILVYVVSEYESGYAVQIDSDGPCRYVSEIKFKNENQQGL